MTSLPGGRPRTSLGILLFFLLLAHILVMIGTPLTLHRAMHQPREIPLEARRWMIDPGMSLSTVLGRLHQRELAPHPELAKVYLSLSGRDFVLKAGHYLLDPSMSTMQILKHFDSGKELLKKITIPEGLDLFEFKEFLEAADLSGPLPELWVGTLIADLDPQASSLEGYLFPETYSVPEGMSRVSFVTLVLEAFRQEVKNQSNAFIQSGLTLREWVTIASLVEKETHLPQERQRIAGVFLNRLKKNMKLQCDPTVIYGLKLQDRYRGKIFASDLKRDDPYNTYQRAGLPPGPIASPGAASLAAVLAPEPHEYLYFVVQPTGGHAFSKTLREHNLAVKRYRQWQKQTP
jgi:UPF0755 protein